MCSPDKDGQASAEIDVTSEMIDAGALILYDYAWECFPWGGDRAKRLAGLVYEAMEVAGPVAVQVSPRALRKAVRAWSRAIS